MRWRLKKDVLKDLPDKLEKYVMRLFDTKQQKLGDGQVVHSRLMLENRRMRNLFRIN